MDFSTALFGTPENFLGMDGQKSFIRCYDIFPLPERFEYEFYGLLKGFIQTLEANSPKLAQGASPKSPPPDTEGYAGESKDGADEPSSGGLVFPEENPR